MPSPLRNGGPNGGPRRTQVVSSFMNVDTHLLLQVNTSSRPMTLGDPPIAYSWALTRH